MFRYFVLLLIWVVCCSSICAGAPESSKNLKSEKSDAKGQQKIQTRSAKAYHPCPHHGQDNIYSLIQAQSEGRIVNKPHYNNVNQALEAAASNSLAQTVTLNSQIAVGGGASSGVSIDHQNLPAAGRPPVFNSNAYLPPAQVHAPPQQPQPIPLPFPAQVPQPPPAPHFNPNFQRPNHYETAQGHQQQGYQYASAFTSNRFSSAQTNFQQQNHHHNQQNSNYNYRPPHQQLNNAHNQFGNGAYAGSFSHQTHGQHQQHFGGSNAGVHPIPSIPHNSIDPQLGHIIQNTFAQASLDPSAEKHIYVHVPPEDLEEKSVQHTQLVQPPAQKHYKIIFIKAPTYNQPNAAQLAAAAAAQQAEEKTLIYVLVKKPEEPSVEELQQIQETAIKHHKPEVYFIKYKTRKEGEDLQNQLLQQGTLPGAPELGGIDIRGGGIEGHSSSSVSTSSSYATSAISTPSSHQPDEFYGVPIQ